MSQILFEEDEKDSKPRFLDHIYMEGMYEMFKKVNGESFSSEYKRLDWKMCFSWGKNDRMVSYWAQTMCFRSSNGLLPNL